MNEIRHRVGIKANVQDVYEAVYHPSKLVRWWPAKATGTPNLGSRIELEFPGYPSFVWKIADLAANERVRLNFVSGPDPWRDSELFFEISETNKQVFVTLTHVTGPDTPQEAFQFFCTKWPLFLVSLKDFLETGQGNPYPNDIRIQHD
jgi:uncharacterized protein YndB with AHSA1/START domain